MCRIGRSSAIVAAVLQVRAVLARARPRADGSARSRRGTLNLSFKPGFAPSAGDTLTLISSGTLTGRFSAINAPGFKVTPTYTGTQLIVRFDA